MAINLTESLGAHAARTKKGDIHEPLISLLEFAAQQGVNPRIISGKLSRSLNAPKAVVAHKGKSGSWYKPDEITAWWEANKAPATRLGQRDSKTKIENLRKACLLYERALNESWPTGELPAAIQMLWTEAKRHQADADQSS